MTKDEALRLALEAMKIKQQVTMWANDGDKAKFNKAIKAVEAALEAKDEPEYYGLTKDHLWMSISKEHYDRLKPEFRMTCYTTPPQQEAKDEPVAWWIPKHKAPDMVSKVRWSDECEPLYTTPPQRTWVGLTDEEIKQSYRLKCMEFGHWLDERTFLIACNWAETKLKDKNT